MIEFDDFVRKANVPASEVSHIRLEWDYALGIASYVLDRFPDIGFLSATKRLNAFLIACEVFQGLIDEKSGITFKQCILPMIILRTCSASFDKAYICFMLRVKQGRFNKENLNDFAYRVALNIMQGEV